MAGLQAHTSTWTVCGSSVKTVSTSKHSEHKYASSGYTLRWLRGHIMQLKLQSCFKSYNFLKAGFYTLFNFVAPPLINSQYSCQNQSVNHGLLLKLSSAVWNIKLLFCSIHIIRNIIKMTLFTLLYLWQVLCYRNMRNMFSNWNLLSKLKTTETNSHLFEWLWLFALVVCNSTHSTYQCRQIHKKHLTRKCFIHFHLQ